jgi:hypothetical protein
MKIFIALLVVLFLGMSSSFAEDSSYKWMGYTSSGNYMWGNMKHTHNNSYKISGYDSNGNYYWGRAKQSYSNPNKFSGTLYNSNGEFINFTLKSRDW